jgi:tetratricopeptide (TPR) repeat protein
LKHHSRLKKVLIGFTLATVSGGACGGSVASAATGPKWQAQVPAVAQDPALWAKMISDMQDRGMYYGAMASVRHMIAFFPDVATKEIAYKAAISIIDQGYPVPAREIFVPGDLEPDPAGGPDAYQFANSYYLYKAMLSKEKNQDHWAQVYLDKIDKDNFSKYIFFSGIDEYSKGNLQKAEDLVNKALAKDVGTQSRAFATKMVRTLARIYFEEGEYDKALEIYNSFLLKLNPIVPLDWLEAAWCEFHLKHYPEALGFLYNLESKVGSKPASLEKYNIRALVYRATCSIPSMEELIKSFDQTFGPVLDGIKHGESLDSFPILKGLDLPENADYSQTRETLIELAKELGKAKKFTGPEGPLAGYLYHSEIKLLELKLRAITPDALNRAASQILTISEQMRFLRFDIERSKFNPDLVFKPVADEDHRVAVAPGTDGETYEVRWMQFGDYWLDERNKFKGVISDQCGQ